MSLILLVAVAVVVAVVVVVDVSVVVAVVVVAIVDDVVVECRQVQCFRMTFASVSIWASMPNANKKKQYFH